MVIAIIALLAALLLPALGRAKMKAHQVACLSNERQIDLSYQVHRDQDGPGRLDGPGVVDWYQQEQGRTELGWICASAPVAKIPGALSVSGVSGPQGTLGTVRSAWQKTTWEQDGGPLPVWLPSPRAGSYAINCWLRDLAWIRRYPAYFQQPDGPSPPPLDPRDFSNESQVAYPGATPVVADGLHWWVWPVAQDPPPPNLVYGFFAGPSPSFNSADMGIVAIPRHGTRPARIPTDWPASQPLPGAVNVAFFDGHAGLVKLDDLWQLYWHAGYQPPAKRPGLP